MARPAVSTAAEAVYADLQVTQPYDEQLDWPFLRFIAAFVSPLTVLYDLVRDTDEGPGWSALVDADRVPAEYLFWLAQMVGVRLQEGASEEFQRAQITTPAPLRRGTPAAMREAARATLSGTKTVTIIEADASPYRLTVQTRTDETVDADATLAALLSQKPVGLVLTHIVGDIDTWDEQTDTWDDVDADVTWDESIVAPDPDPTAGFGADVPNDSFGQRFADRRARRSM